MQLSGLVYLLKCWWWCGCELSLSSARSRARNSVDGPALESPLALSHIMLVCVARSLAGQARNSARLSLTRAGNTNINMNTQTIAIKPLDQIRAQFVFNADCTVHFKKGADINADELATILIADCDSVGSVVERAVNMIRLARNLKPVQIGTTDKPEEMPAFEYVSAKVERECATKSTWSNVKGLIQYADIKDANNLPGSVYVVKEWTAYAGKMGLLDVKTGKLRDGAKSDPVIALAIEGKAKVNAIRPVLQKAKADANTAAIAQKKEAPFPTRATATASTTTPTTPTVTTATMLSSIANARFAVTKLCESGQAAEVKKALLADEAFKSLLALVGAVIK